MRLLKFSEIRTGAKFKHEGKNYIKIGQVLAKNTRSKKIKEFSPDTEIQ